MTDEAILNNARSAAVGFLLKETFTHINEAMIEKYQVLGKANASLLLVTDTRFINDGTIYPPVVGNIIPYGSHVPNLHHSLLTELEAINKMASQADFHYIKNFFVAVISQSQNAIVLNELLPAILINALKQHFTVNEFKVIDTGVYGGLQQEPISVTKENIRAMKEHYKSTIEIVQHLLMDKFLLQK